MTSAHLDYETLADLAEGLLDPDHAASADAHLADCAQCQERTHEISAVSRLLAEATVPPMPAGLAGRIDAAIAAEMPPLDEVAQARARRGSRRLRLLSAAAAAAVLVGGGITMTMAKLSFDDSLAPSAAGSASGPAMEDHAKLDRERGQRGSTASGPSVMIESASYPLLRTGTDYRRSTLGAQVAGQVAASTRQPAAGGQSGPRSATLLGCIERVTSGRPPMMVDQARFEGRDATMIVLTGDTPERLDVWFVGPACSAQESDLLAHTQVDR